MAATKRANRNGEWWVDFRYRGKRIRKRSPIQTKRGTEAYERQLLCEFQEDEAHGKNPFVEPPKFAEFAERWMRDYVDPHNRPSSAYSKRGALRRHLLPQFGNANLDAIKTEQIDAFAARMRREGRSPKTVNNVLSMLRSSLTCAHSWGLLSHVPEFHWQKVPSQGYRFLEPDQAHRLLNAASTKNDDPSFWYALILFFLRTGGRFSEVAVLKWTDLSLDAARPFVRFWRGRSSNVEGPTKTNRCRDVPLASDLVPVLQSMGRSADRVFEHYPGALIKADNLLWSLKRLCTKANVPQISWKDLRHTFATDLTREGVPLNTVSRLLGHTTLHMTMRYAHTPETSMFEAVELLARRATMQQQRPLARTNGLQEDTSTPMPTPIAAYAWQ